MKNKHARNTTDTLFHLADHRGTVMYIEENGETLKIRVRDRVINVTKSEAEEIVTRIGAWAGKRS